jgi:hypothetical protein
VLLQFANKRADRVPEFDVSRRAKTHRSRTEKSGGD